MRQRVQEKRCIKHYLQKLTNHLKIKLKAVNIIMFLVISFFNPCMNMQGFSSTQINHTE